MDDSRSPETLIEEDLVAQCLRRPIQQEAWREFWRRFYPVIYSKTAKTLRRFGGRLQEAEVDDVVQLVFLKIFNGLDRYDRQKSPLSAYLSLVTRRTIVDQIRHSVRILESVPFEQMESFAVTLVHEPLDMDKAWHAVFEALGRFDDEKRRILEDYLAGETTEAICRRHGISPSLLYTSVYRFKNRLKKILQEK